VPRALLPHLIRSLVATFAALSALGQGGGCIEPDTEYKDFIARAPAPSLDASPSAGDSAPPALPCAQLMADAGGLSGTFYGACLTTASAGDATQAIYTVVDFTVTPGSGGAADTVSASMTSLQLKPTNVSQTVGGVSNPPPAPLSSACTFVLDAGTISIPGPANATGAVLTMTGTTYSCKLLTPDASCGAFSATITMPVMLDLTKGGNYCVFRRAPADGSITLFTLSDFTCPDAAG